MNKILLYIFLFLIFYFQNLVSADEKRNVIDKLKKIKSLEFKFKQKMNGVHETGICYLVFPSKLKCNYNDDKKKELIINKNRLAVTQKRYNKTYYYSVKKSPFLKMLKKNELIALVEKSILSYKDNKINFTNIDSNGKKITVFFNKKDFNLNGWEMDDQLKNKIIFFVEILSENKEIETKIFKIPTQQY